ncbi:MAG: hypothetical protein KBS81_00905 [Spirochaetales bacterium]|nr:hypothetical protein [Candidatus Physcosoma equi]
MESHLVFESGIHFKLSMVSGLYYNEKLDVIERAISEKQNLYYLDAENKEYLVRPLSLDKSDLENVILLTDKGPVPIGPIWKITSVPAVLR